MADFRPHAYAMYCSNISIGKNVVIRPGSVIEADADARVILGDDVMLGPNVYFYVNDHKFERRDIPLSSQGYYPSEDIVVQDGAWIGANSTLLCGVKIGRNAVVAAGSVVTKMYRLYRCRWRASEKIKSFSRWVLMRERPDHTLLR